MKTWKKILCLLLTMALLASAVPAAFASGGSRVPVGLNGAGGKWSAFDTSVYTLVTDYEHVTAPGFTWPSSGAVLVQEAASNTTYVITRYKGVTIPAGLVVDFYRYSTISDAYAMQAHFDTTDGKPYTIGAETTNVGTSGTPNAKLGTARRTFTPGIPSETYSRSFTDVDAAAWYYDAVMTTAEGKLLVGYGNGKFGPNDPLTRAQTQIVEHRLLGNSYEGYTDTATATRAYAAILLGNTTTYGGTVQLNPYERSLLLRETDYVPGLLFQVKTLDTQKGDYVNGLVPGYNPDLAIAITQRSVYDNWLASLNSGKKVTYRYSLDEFPDGAAIRQWIQENVGVMREALILPSYTDAQVAASCEYWFLRAWNLGMFGGVDSAGTFNPYGALTRSQLSQVLYNMGWTYYGCLDYNAITSSGRYK